MSTPTLLVFLGRVIGPHTGWDGDNDNMTFYDVVPSLALSDGGLPPGDLTFSIVTGKVEAHDPDTGGVIWSGDILDILPKFPKVAA